MSSSPPPIRDDTKFSLAPLSPSSQATPEEPRFTPAPKSPPSPPPAEPAEARKIANLEAKIATLGTQVRETEEKQMEVDKKLKTKDPSATVKAHIKLLHDYNEIRDIGQGLMGIIADNRGVRVVDVYRDFDVGEGD